MFVQCWSFKTLNSSQVSKKLSVAIGPLMAWKFCWKSLIYPITNALLIGYPGVLFVKGHGLPLSKSRLTIEFTVPGVASTPTNVMLLPQFDGSFKSLWHTVETRPRPKGVVTEIRWRKDHRNMGPWLKLSFSYRLYSTTTLSGSYFDFLGRKNAF